MSGTYGFSKLAAVLITVFFVVTLTAASALAVTQFEGTWSTQDTKGNPFVITLSEDGKATADRADEGLTGTWKAEGDSAVINWNSGWVTKIVKQGDQFQKQAFESGDTSGTPTHTADAEKQTKAQAPANDQQADTRDATARVDTRFDWGWLGLIGLFGLFGLAGRRDVVSRTTRTVDTT
jgi:hypothetical protein